MDIENKSIISDEEFQYLEQIKDLYDTNKEWFIRAEERLPEMKLFVAPVLEHRDALDHLMRYYAKKRAGEPQERLMEELRSVRGHEIRAFNDVADYTCVLIREYMNDRVRRVSRSKLKRIWDSNTTLTDENGNKLEYLQIREYLIDNSEELARIRMNRENSLGHIETYKAVLKRFYQIFDDFRINVEHHL